MKKLLYVILGFLCYAVIYSQDFSVESEVVNKFPFDTNFTYFSGYIPEYLTGDGGMLFLDKNQILIGHNVFGTNFKLLYPFNINYSSFLVFTTKYLIVVTQRVSEPDWVGFVVYSKQDILKPVCHFEGKGIDEFNSRVIYATGQMIFIGTQGNGRQLVSWELLPDGKTTFRNVNETDKWLIDFGDTVGGYRWDSGIWFGVQRNKGTFEYSLPWMQRVDFSKGKQFGISKFLAKDDFSFIGTDSKGLMYGINYLPWKSKRYNIHLRDEALIFIIVDPWQKRAVFRPLKPQQNMPPVENKHVALHQAVAPDGTLYFFDIDLPNKQYILSKLKNNWWDELGIKNRTVAIVNDNRIRVREKPNLEGTVLSYVYENETALINETSPKKDTIDGKSAPWYRIEMPDGRKGWVFGSFLNIQDY